MNTISIILLSIHGATIAAVYIYGKVKKEI